MASILPPLPRLVMTVLEPISLVAGAITPLLAPGFFASSQLPHLPPHALLPTEHVLALQLGNLYMLLCLLGLFILNTTTEASVVHAYVWALWIADIGHVTATYWVMGLDEFVNVAGWNATTMGNVGATVVLFAVRSMYLLGLLGSDRTPVRGGKKKV